MAAAPPGVAASAINVWWRERGRRRDLPAFVVFEPFRPRDVGLHRDRRQLPG